MNRLKPLRFLVAEFILSIAEGFTLSIAEGFTLSIAEGLLEMTRFKALVTYIS
ncbi:MAG: hypothetical protein ABID54_13685 [Pseudomonadota bacterium]